MELPLRARKELLGLQEQFEEEVAVLNEDLMSFATWLKRLFIGSPRPFCREHMVFSLQNRGLGTYE